MSISTITLAVLHVCTCIISGEESSGEVVGGGEVRAGDGVRVELDPGLFKAAQEDHGGWEDYMAEV